jgi:hypothetical protein
MSDKTGIHTNMVVRNLNTLKAMERAGHIKLHSQTGTKITGLYTRDKFTCYYVDEGYNQFNYKGKLYGVRYSSGCFYPYVIKLNPYTSHLQK